MEMCKTLLQQCKKNNVLKESIDPERAAHTIGYYLQIFEYKL